MSVTDVFGQVVSYAYDASSNRTQLSLNAATSASYQYDAINRLTTLTDAASLATSFSYDSTDKLTSRTLPNGVVTTSQYDDLNRLTRLTHAKAGNTLADFQYQLNAVNNITQMIDGAGTHNYTYDTRDRLTAATHPNQTNESYSLDDVGNRTAPHQGSSKWRVNENSGEVKLRKLRWPPWELLAAFAASYCGNFAPGIPHLRLSEEGVNGRRSRRTSSAADTSG